MSATTNLQIVQKIYQAFGRGDVPGILELVTDDVDFGIDAKTNVPWHGVGKGKAFAAKFFENLGRECEFSRFEPHGFIAGEDGVACLVSFDVTIRRNGNKATLEDIHYFKMRGDRIVKWRGTEDTATTRDLWNG
jgi:ketosteroid isomerase-like protein